MWLPLVLCAAGLAPAPGILRITDQDPAERTSLEDFLREARIERDALHSRLAARADGYLTELGRLPDGASPILVEAAIAGLADLGVDATPLLVQHLEVPGLSAAAPTADSGAEAAEPLTRAQQKQRAAAVRRADRVAEALARMPCDPILEALLELAEHGSPAAQLRALRVLEISDAPERVRPRLLALFEVSHGALAEALLETLIAVGGADQAEFLRAQLTGAEVALVDRTLLALAEVDDVDAAPDVRALLADQRTAELHGPALLAYFVAHPDLVRGSEVMLLVQLAAGSAPRATRLAVLAALPTFGPTLNYDLRTAMKPLLAERDSTLREAALVALASIGDRSSKKTLLAKYDESVERNERWFRGYSDRAWVLLRIGENDAAIKDFRKALEYGKDSATLQPQTYIGLARAFARKGKLKEAADWLRKAPISLADLQALSLDEDFTALRDSRWGKDAFGV